MGDTEVPEGGITKTGLKITLTGKTMAATIATILGIIGTLTAFGISFGTTALSSENDKLKAAHEIQMKHKDEALRDCAQDQNIKGWEKKYKAIVPELMYLKYSYLYTMVSVKYNQNPSDGNLKKMMSTTKRFANFVKSYQKNIIEKESDPFVIELEFSQDKINFAGGRSYMLPQPVKEALEQVK